MHLLVDYIEPLTAWLQANPKSALFITMLISFTESLAIIGSIVPGSLTMTAVGILAGSGVMRIDLTLIVAIIGAIGGDGASYALGYIYHEQLVKIWPFSKYPSLIFYGKEFFLKHGGKSVIIGRFIGPLRSIIPVIAGIMKMPKFLFFFANTISAIGWSILYVMPGYLVGAASNQLSSEGAQRLFVLIIIALLVIWIASKLVHFAIRALTHWYNANINSIYNWLINYRYLKTLFRDSKRAQSINGFTITLILGFIACLIFVFLISIFVIQDTWINNINSAVSFFLQGVRSQYIDTTMIVINLITSPLPILSVFCILLIASLCAKYFRLTRFLLSLGICSILTVFIISSFIDVPNATELFQLSIDATYPVISLTWATAVFSFSIYYLIEFYPRSVVLYLFRIILIIILFLSGISSIYLGDNWLFTVFASYLIGLSLGIGHWIIFQRKLIYQHKIGFTLIAVILTLFTITWAEYFFHGENLHKIHQVELVQKRISKQAWWEQDSPILPVYTTNRMGKKIGIFNIQYVGSLKDLENKLLNIGWTKKLSSTFYSLMIRIDGKHSDVKLPILEQLYLNKRPELIMIFSDEQHKYFYILRLWRSNYKIRKLKQQVWIGSIIQAVDLDEEIHPSEEDDDDASDSIFSPLLKSISKYKLIDMEINNPSKRFKKISNPKLLIFKLD